MSGSDSAGNGGPGVSNIKDCLELYEITVLNSPQPDVLETVEKDDTLEVQLTGESPPRVVALKGDRIAGSITIRSIARLIECIGEGNSYIAIVLEKDGGRCRVQIRPESTL